MTTSAAAVKFSALPISLLKFPPSSLPTTLPPPSDVPAFAHPFSIPTNIYNGALSINVPITVALLYATTVTYLNRYNAQRDHKPWRISHTLLFKALVVTHNVFLALYSAWTFVGMINAVRLSFPGWSSPYGFAGVVDSMCKISGPRGIGSAATYNESTSAWGIANRAMHLAADGLSPDHADAGRIWNEGLAFYGWLFYISKFYEVIDTLIILMKGKKSSFLQMYHHAGAMMCMWAGIRYMAPPIWVFVLINSGLHALMYTYFTLTALSVKIPTYLKRTLTTLQIAQFVVGASYAFIHLFVAYQIPVSVPYAFSLVDLTSVASSAVSAVSTDASSAMSIATATASAGVMSMLKKLAFRAAGREGLAENVVNEQGETFGIDAVHAASDMKARTETRYRDELQWIHCTDTSGETFAILLNCLYLVPLTWLFVRFFIESYNRRMERRRSSTPQIIEQSALDAFKDVARQTMEAVGDVQGVDDDEEEKTVQGTVDAAKGDAKELAAQVKKDAKQAPGAFKDQANKAAEAAKEVPGAVKDQANKAAEAAKQVPGAVKDQANKAAEAAKQAPGAIQEEMKKAAEAAKKAPGAIKEEAKKAVDAAKDVTSGTKEPETH